MQQAEPTQQAQASPKEAKRPGRKLRSATVPQDKVATKKEEVRRSTRRIKQQEAQKEAEADQHDDEEAGDRHRICRQEGGSYQGKRAQEVRFEQNQDHRASIVAQCKLQETECQEMSGVLVHAYSPFVLAFVLRYRVI